MIVINKPRKKRLILRIKKHLILARPPAMEMDVARNLNIQIDSVFAMEEEANRCCRNVITHFVSDELSISSNLKHKQNKPVIGFYGAAK
ncbi:hypothetical protein A9Q87_04655 [Flavobacteriales bacterium 34_180_T64]|nr:hypothetical protein A9Q87_04655 [Flavobacteriales bacterium 34_180_T64]